MGRGHGITRTWAVVGTTVERDITGAVVFTDVKAMAAKVTPAAATRAAATRAAATRGVATKAKVTLAVAITGEVAMTAATPEAGMDSTAAALEDITEAVVHTAAADTGK